MEYPLTSPQACRDPDELSSGGDDSQQPKSTLRRSRKPSRRHTTTHDPAPPRSVSESRLLGRLFRRHLQVHAHSQPPAEQRITPSGRQGPETVAPLMIPCHMTGPRPNTAPHAQSCVATHENVLELKPLPPLPTAGYVPTHAAIDFSRVYPAGIRGSDSLETCPPILEKPASSGIGDDTLVGILGLVLQAGSDQGLDIDSARTMVDPRSERSVAGGTNVALNTLPSDQSVQDATSDEAPKLSDYEQFLQQAEEKEREMRAEFMRRVEKATARTRPRRSHGTTVPLDEIPETHPSQSSTGALAGCAPISPTTRTKRDQRHAAQYVATNRRDSGLAGMDIDRRDGRGSQPSGRADDRREGQSNNPELGMKGPISADIPRTSTSHPHTTTQPRVLGSQPSIAQRVVEYIRPSRLANGFDESASHI